MIAPGSQKFVKTEPVPLKRSRAVLTDQCAENNNPANDSVIQDIKFQLEQLANKGITPRK